MVHVHQLFAIAKLGTNLSAAAEHEVEIYIFNFINQTYFCMDDELSSCVCMVSKLFPQLFGFQTLRNPAFRSLFSGPKILFDSQPAFGDS